MQREKLEGTLNSVNYLLHPLVRSFIENKKDKKPEDQHDECKYLLPVPPSNVFPRDD